MKSLLPVSLGLMLALMPFAALAEDYGSVKVDVGASVDTRVTGDPDFDLKSKTDASVGVDADSKGEAEITGDPDFDLFVKSVETEDDRVAAADVTGDGVAEVEYKHQGRLFGFIPLMVTSKTTVDSDADGKVRVKVRFPWWSFLVGGVSQIRSDVEASLSANADVQSSISAARESSTGMATGKRMQLVQAMVKAIMSADVAARASYDLKANTK